MTHTAVTPNARSVFCQKKTFVTFCPLIGGLMCFFFKKPSSIQDTDYMLLTTIHSDRAGRSGGTVILLRRFDDLQPPSTFSLEICDVRVRISIDTAVIYSLYISPQSAFSARPFLFSTFHYHRKRSEFEACLLTLLCFQSEVCWLRSNSNDFQNFYYSNAVSSPS